jgi:hypothetical protein
MSRSRAPAAKVPPQGRSGIGHRPGGWPGGGLALCDSAVMERDEQGDDSEPRVLVALLITVAIWGWLFWLL